MTIQDYLDSVPAEKLPYIDRLRAAIKERLPPGFSEEISYGMIGYVVPHSLYPAGYHCKPSEPLPFMSIASQKGAIHFYHMGLYNDPALLSWFTSEYAKTAKHKIDMGKSCVRFKHYDEIPFDLIGELASKITARQWIDTYEREIKRGRR